MTFAFSQGGSALRDEGNPAVQLYPFRSPANGKIGYIDARGNIKIPPQFSDCGGINAGPEFSGGRVAVGCAPVGYADASGTQLIAAQFDDARPFSQEMAAVKYADGNWGYINSNGKPAIPAKFTDAGKFSEGLAPVSDANGAWGYVDTTGSTKVPFRFEQAGNFSGGLAPVEVDGQFGYVDKAGKLALSPQFKNAKPFSEGLAAVLSDGWHYIGKDGKPALPGSYLQAGDFSEGFAAVKAEESNSFGYIDRTGAFAIRPQFESANSFHHGLALVYFKTDKIEGPEGKRVLHYGYINKSGRTVFSSQLSYVEKRVQGRGGSGTRSYIPMTAVNIESLPAGAKVYLIPLADLESDKNLANDKDKMLQYLLNGYTPLHDYEVIEQVYRVMIEFNGKRVARQFDVNQHSPRNLQIDFHKE